MLTHQTRTVLAAVLKRARGARSFDRAPRRGPRSSCPGA